MCVCVCGGGGGGGAGGEAARLHFLTKLYMETDTSDHDLPRRVVNNQNMLVE